MTRRSCARILAAGVLAAASLLGSGGGSAAGGAATSAAGPALVPASATTIPTTDLAITHRLAGGGMNLWRLPLSDFELAYGQPQLVKKLDYGGFSYDRSVTLGGDIGNVTPSDDGTDDFVIWQAQPNGGVLLWGVGGGGDPTPQLWADLRTGGWSYLASTPLIADVTGDGWDDLVVIHRNGTFDNVWLFPSNGQRLGAPQLMGQIPHDPGSRNLMADINGDGHSDLVTVRTGYIQAGPGAGPALEYDVRYTDPQSDSIYWWKYFTLFDGPADAGWSYGGSRQLAGDVDGDGLVDLVTIHAQPGGGMLVWVHLNCTTASQPECFKAPEVWQSLMTGGWSFAGSRQYMADIDGNGTKDLVTVHSQAGNSGELVWGALSSGLSFPPPHFTTPQVIANLQTGGWSYLDSRENAAHLRGQVF